jgi:hypothetical protein
MRKAQYTKPLTVALRPDIYEEVKRITDKEQISMADWVRDSIETTLSKNSGKVDERLPDKPFTFELPDEVREERFIKIPKGAEISCECCGVHVDDIDPARDATCNLLYMCHRPFAIYDEETEIIIKEAGNSKDFETFLIEKYGEEKLRHVNDYMSARCTSYEDWECRDCWPLSDEEYYGKKRKREREESRGRQIKID